MYVRHLVPLITDIFRDCLRGTPVSFHDRDVLFLLENLTDFYQILECTDYALSDEEQTRFAKCIDDILKTYRTLQLGAIDHNRKRWTEVPKFHDAQHIALQSVYSNPRWGWCYPDEDFMRILKANQS